MKHGGMVPYSRIDVSYQELPKLTILPNVRADLLQLDTFYLPFTYTGLN
jgi:hypothetical protein